MPVPASPSGKRKAEGAGETVDEILEQIGEESNMDEEEVEAMKANFREESIGVAALRLLGKDEMKELGLKIGPRILLSEKIKKMKLSAEEAQESW